MKKSLLMLWIIVILIPNSISAWIYPEHRDITILAIKKLSAENKVILDKLWTLAIRGNENRLSETMIIPDSEIPKGKIDFASWPAIAGDHSISASDLLYIVLTKDWILEVEDIALRLKKNLAIAKNHQDINNALRGSDILLQRSDPEYATRAGHNDVHFLPPLINENVRLDEYIKESIKIGAPLNAIGIYIWYHYSALAKASRLSDHLTTEQKKI